MQQVERELENSLSVHWKSFLLRPSPRAGRTLEDFREYTRSWQRPADEEPLAPFRAWDSSEGPPSHSVPPHVWFKRAQELDGEKAGRLHEVLMRAYFVDSRDITSDGNLERLWADAGLPASERPDSNDQRLVEQVHDDHAEALDNGAGGAPAFRMDGAFGVLMGAQPTDLLRRWVEQELSRAG